MEQAKAAVAFTSIVISSDGTPEGTSVKINGNEVKNLSGLYMYLYNEPSYKSVSINYTTGDVNPKPGQLSVRQSFTLIPPCNDKAEASFVEADPKAGISNCGVVTPTKAGIELYSKL